MKVGAESFREWGWLQWPHCLEKWGREEGGDSRPESYSQLLPLTAQPEAGPTLHPSSGVAHTGG